MTGTELVVGLVILAGLVGIVVPVMPGSVLILGAVLVWALTAGATAAWTVFGVVTFLLALGAVVKYLVPGRRLQAGGVPNRTLLLGGLMAVIGFFVIPVVGLFLGFVAGVYAAELARVGQQQAWPSTKQALLAVGLSVLIELATGLMAAVVWLAGAILV